MNGHQCRNVLEDFVPPAENDVWGLGPPHGEIPC